MTRGSAGPTQTDADLFRHILTHRNFNIQGKKLREQAANFDRRFATRIYNSEAIDSYVNCRLIPLNKCPGVRPIGVGETFRQIIGKTIGWILKLDIQEVAGPLQTCTGLKSGAEAAVHYMQEQYRVKSSEAVILVDVSNAFNSVNRQALLRNLKILCPQFSKVAFNMYRRPCRMFVAGTEIQSQEGTTQGDNLAMALFALGTLPLLATLADRHREVSQVWLADDVTASGALETLWEWWQCIITEGKKYGHHVNEGKSCVIVKNESHVTRAKEIFAGSSISDKIRTDGHRHLGAAYGSDSFREEYILALVGKWKGMLQRLTQFSKSQPHAAHSAFTHGLRHKFTYFMRTMELGNFMEPLDELISYEFIPSLFGGQISPSERKLISLPVKYGGMGIPILTELARKEYSTSVLVTRRLVDAMRASNVRARGFYRAGQQAYFDVKVLNPNAESYSKLPMKIVYDRAEKQKIWAYNDRIVNVEHGTFVPLIFSTSGEWVARLRHLLSCYVIKFRQKTI